MEYDDYESLPNNTNVYTHMFAGAAAGIMEHCCMYPVDSVKTRMQSLITYKLYEGKNLFQNLGNIVRTEGIFRPIRGINAVLFGAGPAHALYFSSYEALKAFLLQSNGPLFKTVSNHSTISPLKAKAHCNNNNPNLTINPISRTQETLAHGAAGMCATVLHDAIMNPVEVVKQRLQALNSPYKGAIECSRSIWAKEGFRAFYRSYGTQLMLNVPFQTTHFVTYEFCRRTLFEFRHRDRHKKNITPTTSDSSKLTKNESNTTLFSSQNSPYNNSYYYDPVAHLVSGALAGGLAAAITTPLDVCKTLLNTQELACCKNPGSAIITPQQYNNTYNSFNPGNNGNNEKSTIKHSSLSPKYTHNIKPPTNTRHKTSPPLFQTSYTVLSTYSLTNSSNDAAKHLTNVKKTDTHTQTHQNNLKNNPPSRNICSLPQYKTLLNNQVFAKHLSSMGGVSENVSHTSSIKGFWQAARLVYGVRGFRGFAQGLQARCIYQMPATGLSWSVYEFFKYWLASSATSAKDSTAAKYVETT